MTGRDPPTSAAAGMRSGPRRLRLAIPWLKRQVVEDAGAVHVEAAEWLAARGESVPAPDGDWRQWLLEDSEPGNGLLERYPAGPCCRAACVDEVPSGTWACASPVHLQTAIEHLRIAPPGVVALAADEVAAIDATLQGYFSMADHAFSPDGRGAWLWSSPTQVQCTSVEPSVAAGRNLREVMPAGRDGPALRRLMNEVQMLLHEHPVNERRIADGEATVNALWPWGFGCVGEPSTVLPRLFSDDAWLIGLARLHGATCGTLPEVEGELRSPSRLTVAGSAGMASFRTPADALQTLERMCFRPARDALVNGALGEVELLLGDHALRVVRRDRWRIWRRVRPLAEWLG